MDDQIPPQPPPAAGVDDDDRVPIFGTWRGIYASVVVTTLAVLALLALFQSWSF